jgi:glycosyltransferase involved in cell wall biosynthesis
VVDEVRELVPAVATRSSVVHNAIPVDPRPPTAPPDEPRIVCVGRLVPQKGWDVAVAALPLVLEHVPDAMLVIAGDGSERDALGEQATALGVAEHVDFLGVVPHHDVGALLDTAAVVAMPSRFEGLPLVWLEAASRGRPIVATSVQGLGEVAVDGHTGLVVPVDDPSALAAGLVRVLTDRGLARTLGDAARALVTSEYTLPTCVDRYVALFEHVRATRGLQGAG